MQKADGSRVTDIDPFIEQIVIEHVKNAFGEPDMIVREEASDSNRKTVDEISKAGLLLTVDGVDGTGRFISHFNDGEPNAEWLTAMTAVYERNDKTGNFRPILSFAYQPTTDCLFVLAEGRPVLIADPLGAAYIFDLTADALDVSSPRGTIDVYLQKDRRTHSIDEKLATQWGPSGFNAVSLLACCAVGREPNYTKRVNFTSFHYTLWDFGLWPILSAAGLSTVDFEDTTKEYNELDVHLFGKNSQLPEKIGRPLLISHPKLVTDLRGIITTKI